MHPRHLYYLQIVILNFAMTLMMTTAIVYRIDIVGLKAYELILLGTALEISVILFEVPTGLLADLHSRKTSVIIGFFIIGLGFLMEAFIPVFIWIFIAQIIWGFGYTFISGALNAWVSDETYNIEIEKTFVKASTLGKISTIFGIVCALALGLISIYINMLISGFLMMTFSLFLVIYMKEKVPFKEKRELKFHFFGQFKKGMKCIMKHPVLKIFILTAFLLGLYSEGIDRLEELIILDQIRSIISVDLPSIVIVSFMHALMAFVGLIMLLIMKRYVIEGKKVYQWFFVLLIIMSLGLILFSQTHLVIFSLIGFLLFRMARQGIDPLYQSIQARFAPNHIKATVMSTFGQIDAVGQIASGILMTSIVFYFNIPMVLYVSAIILLFCALSVSFMHKVHSNIT